MVKTWVLDFGELRYVGRVLAVLMLLFAATGALAAPVDQAYPEARQFFPDATRFGDMDGNPPAAPVYQGDKVVGYVFESKKVSPVPAYSGEPVNILVAIDDTGKIVGTKVLEQHEPILLVGIPVQKLYDFVSRYIGHAVTDNIVVGGGPEGSVVIDAISSATVTAMAVNQTIMDSAVKVAVSRKLVAADAVDGAAGPATVRKDYYQKATWQSLLGNGAIRRMHLTRAQVVEAFKGKPAPLSPDKTTLPPGKGKGRGKQTFIDLYYTYLNPPTVGRNLLGPDRYKHLMSRLQPGDHAIAVVANGIYSFKGLGYVRGGIFDRVHVMQDKKMILFHDSDFDRLTDPDLSGMPDFKEKAVFIVRHGYGFDPGRPWTLQLLVRRQTGPVDSIYTTFNGGYQVPAAYVSQPPKPASAARNQPLWVKIWHDRAIQIGVLIAGLVVLTLIMTFQDWLVRRPVLLERIRVGYLLYTLFFIGWYALAQLSVVNVLTFVHSVLHDFKWSTFLVDPLIFILWVFVAVTLLLLGRGIYCGWLCPFGALQTLVNKAARYFKVPQYEFPPYVHERLWAVKYIILLVLFGISLQSVNMAERYAEVEPFKTAINLHFMRSWGFAAYALGLVAVSAFNAKFYCKYVCPLGGGLAVAGRFRLFEWLRRRRECGRPCQVCAEECEVQAINPIGQINFNECHYCLDCQATYANEFKCPPLVEQRKRMERVKARLAKASGGEAPKQPTDKTTA